MNIASFPGLLTPVFVACSSNALVLQATNTGVRKPGNEHGLLLIILKCLNPTINKQPVSYDAAQLYCVQLYMHMTTYFLCFGD